MRQHSKRKKSCPFSGKNGQAIDYKNIDTLKEFVMAEAGYRMVPRRITGVSSGHQRELSSAIKLARYLALIPYCHMHK